MDYDFSILVTYFRKKEIDIDFEEFRYQLQSHPDFPSLLSISDTLFFFKVDNVAANMSLEEINQISDNFIALLNYKNDVPTFFYIEKNGEGYTILKEGKTEIITLPKLKQIWSDVVLLVEKNEDYVHEKPNSKLTILFSSFSLVFLAFIYLYESSFYNKLFLILPFTGLVLSINILKNLFSFKSKLVDAFCNLNSTTSCSAVLSSNKWRFFSIVSLSDLSIIFFSTQIVGFLFFLLKNDLHFFFSFQKFIIYFSFPIILSSIIFQKFVEKKWCPICLLISLVVIIEFIYLKDYNFYNFFKSSISILFLTLLFLFIAYIWVNLKNILSNYKELKESQLNSNRFARNYNVFKNTLFKSPKAELPHTSLVFGNKCSKLNITLFTNPFCSHCEAVHETIDSILNKFLNEVRVEIIIKVDIHRQSDDIKEFYRSMVSTYLNKNEFYFNEAMKFWYDNKSIENWMFNYKSENINIETIDSEFVLHNNWTIDNGYNYTPAIFINGYEYPKEYNRKDLIYFVNELVEDFNS